MFIQMKMGYAYLQVAVYMYFTKMSYPYFVRPRGGAYPY